MIGIRAFKFISSVKQSHARSCRVVDIKRGKNTQIWGIFMSFLRVYILISEITTDIQGRSQTLYTALSNGIVSHGAQIAGLGVFADHTEKQMQNKCVHDFALCGILCMFIFMLRWQKMQVTYAPNKP